MKPACIAFWLALRFGAASVLRGESKPPPVSGAIKASGNATVDSQDAAAIIKAVASETRMDRADAVQMRAAAMISERAARGEESQAGADFRDSVAIQKADRLWSMAEDAQAQDELKDSPEDVVVLHKAVKLEVDAEERDAARLRDVAKKEETDAREVLKESQRVHKDADNIETNANNDLEQEKADLEALRFGAAPVPRGESKPPPVSGAIKASGNATVDSQDAVAIIKGVASETRMNRADAVQMRAVAVISEREAKEEESQADADFRDSAAIQKADRLWSKAEDAQAQNELKDSPEDVVVLHRAVKLEVDVEERDAAQLEDVAKKEKTDAKEVLKESERVRKDADNIDTDAKHDLEQEKADLEALKKAVQKESARLWPDTAKNAAQKGGCTARVSSPGSSLVEDIPNMVHGESVVLRGAGQLKKVEGSCPEQLKFDSAEGSLVSIDGSSNSASVVCIKKPCCMAFKCGASGAAWAH